MRSTRSFASLAASIARSAADLAALASLLAPRAAADASLAASEAADIALSKVATRAVSESSASWETQPLNRNTATRANKTFFTYGSLIGLSGHAHPTRKKEKLKRYLAFR